MGKGFPLRVRAVTIDLDGTLADSVPDLAAAVNRMLRDLGRAPLAESRVRTFVGKGIAKLVERALAGCLEGGADPEALERALPLFERHYAAVNGQRTVLFPGAREALEALRAKGLPLACVTNKARRFAAPLLESLGIAPFFSELVAGDTLPEKKPDPAPLLYAARALGVAPARMLVIGDSLNDALAARAAGCPVLCVAYGYNEGRDVRELDVDAIVSSLPEATRLIEKA